MVLVLGLHLGRECVPLRTLDLPAGTRLAVGSGHLLGAILGKLAADSFALRLGAAAAVGPVRRGPRFVS